MIFYIVLYITIIIIIIITFLIAAECMDGDIRLFYEIYDSYSSTVTGVFEVCINGTWTSVCADSIDFEDPYVQDQAKLACVCGLNYAGQLQWLTNGWLKYSLHWIIIWKCSSAVQHINHISYKMVQKWSCIKV